MLIHAYTQPGGYMPGYVNLSHHEGEKEPLLTVRTPGANGTQVASVPVPREELLKMADEIIARYR